MGTTFHAFPTTAKSTIYPCYTEEMQGTLFASKHVFHLKSIIYITIAFLVLNSESNIFSNTHFFISLNQYSSYLK